MGRFDLSPEEITEGSVLRGLVLLSMPLFAQNMVRVVQQVIDLFWVGQYSSAGVAAIGLASPIVGLLLTSSISATFIGTQVLVSQRVGADDALGARRAAFTGLVLTVVFCVAIGAAMFSNVERLIGLLMSVRVNGASGEVTRLAVQYLHVISLGILFAGLSDVVEASFLGWGDSRATLYMNVISVVVNLGLDPVLIFGVGPAPAMGIQGAALATVAGYAAGWILGVALVARGRAGGIFSRKAVEFDANEFRTVLEIGVPKAVQDAARTVNRLVLVVIVFAAAGSAGLTAFIVGSRVGSLAFRFVMSLSTATQSIVGQNLGADNPDRAVSATWYGVAISVCALGVVGVVQWTIPGVITRVFVPDIGEEALALSMVYLQILVIAYPAEAVFSLVKAGFNGAQRTKLTMVASLTQLWVLQIPMAAIAGVVLWFGAVGVFWAQALSLVVAAVGLGSYYWYVTNNGMYERAITGLSASD